LSSSGDISPDLANEIRSAVSDALDHADEPDEVNGVIHDLQKQIDDAVGSGSATSSAASQLDPALGLLGELLHEGNGNQGEGNGNGNGQD